MSVIIRLQNLPWSANALDIREFFKGLSIPEGGVHIVGGELGDAFIAFSTDEDARLAMRMSGTTLKGIQVTLLLSSRNEMQKVIEAARQQAMALQGFSVPSQPQQQPGPAPASQPQQPQQLPQPPQPPQIQSPPQVKPPLPQQLVPPPQMQQQLPPQVPYPMRGYPQNGSDSHQPLPPMPPHMPHVPPVTMQHMAPQQQDIAYNNVVSQHESNDANVKEEKKEEKRSSSTSNRKDSKGRDGRDSRRRRSRTRSRSRSRSRDRERDRYRRYRSRSRSRSRDRDRSSRHKRSRSRDRDRGRDKNRDRDRGRDRDRDRERERGGRMGRDRADRASQDSNRATSADYQNKDVEVMPISGGIPGLGDIPSVDMRGPLPSSLTEPLRNSPIQTPPGPPPSSEQPPYIPTPVFNNGASFNQQRPFNNSMPFPPQATVPAPNTIDTPTDMELIAEEEGSLDQDEPSGEDSNQPTPDVGISRPSTEQQPMMRAGPVEFPPRFGMPTNMMVPGPGSGPGPVPGPQFGIRGPMDLMRPMRPMMPFGEQQGNIRPPQMEGNGGFQPQNFDPRNQPDQRPPQMNWSGPGGEGSNQGDPMRFRGENNQGPPPREDMDMMNRGPMGERKPREGNEMNEDHGNWDPRSRMRNVEEFDQGWDGPNRPGPNRPGPNRSGPNRPDDLKPPMWNGRGRPPNFHPRNERGPNNNEQEGWQDQGNWEGNDGEFEENFNMRGFRGRGGRGWDRGRGMDRGRGGRGGFNPRQEEFMEGNHDEGFGPRGGHSGFRGRGQSRWGGGGPQFQEETSCVELRNVPVTAPYRVIREAFQYVYVPSNSVKILADEQGNRTGTVYVRLSQPRDAVRALKFSGNYIFDNRIEIVLLNEAKYESEVDIRERGLNRGFRGGPPMEMEKLQVVNSPCLYITGLPMGCADHDVAPVFKDYKIEDIVIERVRGTRTPSGGCFVRLNSPDEAQKASLELANAAIDGSPLSIEMCPPSAMAPAVRDRDLILGKTPSNDKGDKNKQNVKQADPVKQPAKQPQGGGDLLTDSVVIKRVPKDASEANIRDFFSDEGLVPEGIHFCEPGANGMRDVFVAFPLTDDAKRALAKTDQQIGKTKVQVELIAKPIVMNAMGLPFDPMELIKKGHKGNVDAKPKDHSDSPMKVPLEGAEFIPDEEQDDILKGDRPLNGPPMMNMPYPNPEHQFRGRMPGPHPSGRGFMPRGGEMRGMPRNVGPGGRGGMRPPMQRPPVGAPDESIGSAIPPESFGKPGCVVALGNLPYRCSTEDILDFLHEFPGLRPEHVIRRYNEFNQPTADARVSFESPQDAQRVIQTHSKRQMGPRMIYVSLVQS